MCPTYEDEEGGDKNTDPDNAEYLDILKYSMIIIWNIRVPKGYYYYLKQLYK